MPRRKDCYGTMFPDLGHVDSNKPLAGKAFEVLVASHGVGASWRQVKVRHDGWDQCTACECYRDCYDLGMARLALATALETRA